VAATRNLDSIAIDQSSVKPVVKCAKPLFAAWNTAGNALSASKAGPV